MGGGRGGGDDGGINYRSLCVCVWKSACDGGGGVSGGEGMEAEVERGKREEIDRWRMKVTVCGGACVCDWDNDKEGKEVGHVTHDCV